MVSSPVTPQAQHTTQVAGTPPLHNVGFQKILVETFNNVGHPTRCPQPLNSVRQTVSYIVQCLHHDFLKPTLCRGGVPATCVRVMAWHCTTYYCCHRCCLCCSFMTTEVVSLGRRISAGTGCAGCRRVERTV